MATQFTIKTPNPSFSGLRAGVAIANGTGQTSDRAQARELASLGYIVEPDPGNGGAGDDKGEAKK